MRFVTEHTIAGAVLPPAPAGDSRFRCPPASKNRVISPCPSQGNAYLENCSHHCIMTLNKIPYRSEFLTAIRQGRLVIFAGAGVSMGSPSHLPNFRQLAKALAQASGNVMNSSEALDRFLGHLVRKGIKVHQWVADYLQDKQPSPTGLHYDLLRLGTITGPPRIVTTNFDYLFEDAARKLEDEIETLKCYQAPVLPRGSNFDGLVHVHGALDNPEDMVLTDLDFGRAYLTEGSAKDFLADLFREFHILFVGYSHDDVPVDYLSRALPPHETNRRWALGADNPTNKHKWESRGIEFIPFTQEEEDDFAHLYELVAELVSYLQRSPQEWRRLMSTSVQHTPQEFEERDPGFLEQVVDILSHGERVHFFLQADPCIEWIPWLEDKGFLVSLFSADETPEPNPHLVAWIASLMHSEPQELHALVAR